MLDEAKKEKLRKAIASGKVTDKQTLAIYLQNEDLKEELDSKMKEMSDPLRGVDQIKIKGEKGDKGDEPSDGRLKDLITPLIPEPIKGEKGDAGNDAKVIGPEGKQGVAGVDGKDGLNGKNGKDGKDGSDGKRGTDGLDGKDGSPDTRLQIIEKINKGTKGDVKIQTSQLEGFGKIESDMMTRALSILDQRSQYLINKTVKHDGTLSGLGTDASPLSALGLSGSGTLTTLSVVSANGISGSVANSTTTPAITLDIAALDATKIANGAVSNTEFQYLDGVTSAIQTQFTNKANTTLNNLGVTAINASLLFGADSTYDIGSLTVGVNDLHFGSGGVINFDGSDVTLTHSANLLSLAGGDFSIATGTFIKSGANIIFGGNGTNTIFRPDSSGGDIQMQDFAGSTLTTFYSSGGILASGFVTSIGQVYGSDWLGNLQLATKHDIYNALQNFTGNSDGWTSQLQGYTFPDGVNVNTDISAADRWHTLKPIWYEVNGSGVLVVRTVAGYGAYGYDATQLAFIKANSTEQYAVVSGNNPEIHVLTANSTKRTNAINTLTAFCTTNNITGIELDWEGFGAWTPTEYANYLIFTEALAVALHAISKKLILYVPPIWNTSSNGESGSGDEWDSANSQGYYKLTYEDLQTHSADYFMIAVYDYHFDYGASRPGGPLKWQDDIISYAKSKISDVNRIIIGIPGAGHYGATGGYSATPITYVQAAARTGFGGATRDDESGELTWANGGSDNFISDDTSIDIKRLRAQSKGISKIAIWYIGNNKYGTVTGSNPGTASQWTTNGNSINYLNAYFWNDSHITIGDSINNGKLDISGASASTTLGNQDPETSLRFRNTNTTTNNWFDLVFESADNTAAASISSHNVNHTSHYADLVFATRGAGGYRSGLVLSNGIVGINLGLTPVASDGAALGTTALQFSDLFLAEGGVINWDNGDATLTQVGDLVTLAGADLTIPKIGIGISPTATSFATFGASTTGISSFNLPTGSAPTSPVDGDVWRQDNTNTGLKIRINGVTKTISVA